MRRSAAILGLWVILFALVPGARADSIPAATFALQVNAGSPIALTSTVVNNGDGTFGFSGSQMMANWVCDWDFTLDPDPVVSGNFTIKNTTLVTNTYTFVVTLPIAPPIPGSSVMGGSTVQLLTDNNGNGATMGTVAGSAFYRAMVDGGYVGAPAILFAHDSSFSVGAFLSGSNVGASFGVPIPSAAGPAATTSIGIEFQFTLTPGDSASTQGVFVLEPIPEPASMLLLGAGLAGLGLVRRRKR